MVKSIVSLNQVRTLVKSFDDYLADSNGLRIVRTTEDRKIVFRFASRGEYGDSETVYHEEETAGMFSAYRKAVELGQLRAFVLAVYGELVEKYRHVRPTSVRRKIVI